MKESTDRWAIRTFNELESDKQRQSAWLWLHRAELRRLPFFRIIIKRMERAKDERSN